jgi:hypothetical protein
VRKAQGNTHRGGSMNKHEIDEMMKDLPSQKPKESLSDRLLIGTMFILFLVAACIAPDIMR